MRNDRAPNRLYKGLLAIAAGIACLCSAPVLAQVSVAERNNLIAIYTSTGGGGWNNNSNWCSGACPKTGLPSAFNIGNECTWYGIECDGATPPHVIALQLPLNNLIGTLPSLSSLTSMQLFALNTNQLTGSIPSLSAMTQLNTFSLAQNQLTGSIPALSALHSLGTFVISSNQLAGSVPDIAGLTSLSFFIIGDNKLSGSLPAPPATLVGSAMPGFPSAYLCPNAFSTAASPNNANWDTATGTTPWWATPYANNKCDDIFTDGFDD